jgi:hypothetical protein
VLTARPSAPQRHEPHVDVSNASGLSAHCEAHVDASDAFGLGRLATRLCYHEPQRHEARVDVASSSSRA